MPLPGPDPTCSSKSIRRPSYGAGATGDTVNIKADTFIWNGIRTGNGGTGSGAVPYGSQAPGPITPGGAGTGQGTLQITANDIEFGYDTESRPTDGASLTRVALGFSAVDFTAFRQDLGEQRRDCPGRPEPGRRGQPGRRQTHLTTPLIASQNGANISFKAGGAINITAPSGAAVADTSKVTDLGGTVSFTGDSVSLDTAVAPAVRSTDPRGNTRRDPRSDANIDLAGRAIPMFDQTAYSWGGDLIVSSAQGNITESAGSVIDVSAANNDAGTISAVAADPSHGEVSFGGTLKGSGGTGYQSGQFSVEAQSVGDFAALNDQLNTGGFFTARSFDIKSGDLTVGGRCQSQLRLYFGGWRLAHREWTIDASGNAPGTILLGARNDLTIASTAVLDAHGHGPADRQLRRADRCQQHRAGATDLRAGHRYSGLRRNDRHVHTGRGLPRPAADQCPTCRLQREPARRVPARRRTPPAEMWPSQRVTNLTSTARPASTSIAFATYTNAPADPSQANDQIINEGYLSEIDQDSQAFIKVAYNNNVAAGALTSACLQVGRADGLRLCLPPASGASRSRAPHRTATLPFRGTLTSPPIVMAPMPIRWCAARARLAFCSSRAGGNLNINGSINDGFAPSTGHAGRQWLDCAEGRPADLQHRAAVSAGVGAGSTFPANSVLGYAIPILGGVLPAGTAAPLNVTLSKTYVIPAGGTAISADDCCAAAPGRRVRDPFLFVPQRHQRHGDCLGHCPRAPMLTVRTTSRTAQEPGDRPSFRRARASSSSVSVRSRGSPFRPAYFRTASRPASPRPIPKARWSMPM